MKRLLVPTLALAFPLLTADSPADFLQKPEPVDTELLTVVFTCETWTNDGSEWLWSAQLFSMEDAFGRYGYFCNRNYEPGSMECDGLREDVAAAFSGHGKCVINSSGSDFTQDPASYTYHFRKFAAICKGRKAEMVDIVYGGCEQILLAE